MAFEHNNTVLEFETMLQRHLKQDRASAIACSGFDADATSAYIEDALGAKSSADYELHLAACSSCRHQLVEFTRLIQSVDLLPARPPNQQPVQQPVWMKWKSAIDEIQGRFKGWLKIDEWNWQTAGLMGGAAAAMLIATLAVQSFKRVAPINDVSVVQMGQVAQPLTSPNSQPSKQLNAGGVSGAEAIVADSNASSGEQKSSVPAPSVKPELKSADQDLVSNLPPRSASLDAQLMRFPAASPNNLNNPGDSASTQMPASGATVLAPSVVPNAATVEEAIKVSRDFREAVTADEDLARSEISSRFNVSPSDNPMRTVAARNSARKPNAKESLQLEKPVWRDRVMGFVPFKKDDGAKPEKMSVDEDSFKAMKIRIRDRIFRFESGAWVDQEYKPEMAWRVTKLVRGGDEFERVLAEEPLLKPYFDKGAITIIWRDKIYKVVGR